MSGKVSLSDKYTKREGRVFLNGTQALVRLPMVQRWRDEQAGLNTAGFISGYRGSPLGNYDLAVKLAALPDSIRGYGPVKEETLLKTKLRCTELMEIWRGGTINASTNIAAE